MSEQIERTLNHFALFAFTDAYWAASAGERADFHGAWLEGLRAASRRFDLYQVFPTEATADILAWSAVPAGEVDTAFDFFDAFARATNPWRRYVRMTETLWGYTKPSQYSRAQRSTQEIDPFADERKRYLVMYPFVKTVEWYLMSRDARQGMMNEHIRIGKQYPEISQLLLYSFGVQDQEFVVVYEMDDLKQFSDLVGDLRGTDARRYTERDTPLHAGFWRPAEEALALFR